MDKNTGPEDIKVVLERFQAMQDVKRVVEGFRIALDALEWYSNRANYQYSGFESIPGWWDAPGVFAHDDGEKAREAIGHIEKAIQADG